MVAHNNKEQFYYEIERKPISDELRQLIEEDKGNDGFYELCKKYSDIALNSQKKFNESTKKVQAVFQEEDIENAENATIGFIFNQGIKDIDGFLDSIKIMYSSAIEWDDKRPQGGKVYSEEKDRNLGRTGKLFDFSKLPDNIWQEIVTDINQKIQAGD